MLLRPLWQMAFAGPEEESALIFFMAGTSDARELALLLHQQGYPLLCSVVTEHAADILQEAGLAARSGRLNQDAMVALLQSQGASVLVDASHPFAAEAHATAMAAAAVCGIPYIRFERKQDTFAADTRLSYVDTYEAAADLAAERGGSILLTTGSKTLEIFTSRLLGKPGIRLVARMLPRVDNMEKCARLGLQQQDIIGMQGPFPRDLNIALYRFYQTTLMVTKESGGPGAVDEKVQAALDCDIEVIVIGRPKLDYPQMYRNPADVLAELSRVYPVPTTGGVADV
jgi:precorrin-6A/cobalt-precorrin-6A reductase